MESRAIPEPIDVAVCKPRPPQRWVLVVPVMIAAYLVGLAIYLSLHRIMWLDEFFAWGILTDPSFKHAMGAWLEGADSGGALYYILGHTLLALTGPSVLAARLFGALLLAGAYVIWFRTLLRVFSGRVALLGSSVLLLSAGYINYLAEVRFYPQLIAAVVLAIWLALWVQRGSRSSGYTFVVFFLVHGALVSSHLLGVVYSAMLLAGMLFCRRPQRYVAATLGVLAGWSLLLFARQPIHVGGVRVASMLLMPPRWTDFFQFYQSQPSALHRVNLLLSVPVLASAGLWLWQRMRGRHEVGWLRSDVALLRDDAHSLLFRISILLGATPLLFFVESRVTPWPLWVLRYMLPSIFGISGLTAFALAFQSRQPWIQRRTQRARDCVFVAVLVALVGWHIEGVRHQAPRPAFTQTQLKPLERGLPIVVSDAQLFFQFKFYESGELPPVYYVYVPRTSAVVERNDLMRTIQRQRYWGDSFRSNEDLQREVSEFVLLAYLERDAYLIAHLREHGWDVTLLGTQELDGLETPILRVTRPRS